LLAQPTGQVMPSTVRQTSLEALASAVAEAAPDELAEELAELAVGLLGPESDCPHPANATLSAMNTGAER
jgi:hypothetical protein